MTNAISQVSSTSDKPRVAVIMGSQSDWPTMRNAIETLDTLGVACEARIISAHRTPDRMFDFARSARDEGFHVIIAGAGGAAHLPGMVAALTPLPVFGVPIESKALSGQDSLLSIVQMPAGIPVGTLAIGRAGAVNAALLAGAVLALHDPDVAGRLEEWRAKQSEAVGCTPVDVDPGDVDPGDAGQGDAGQGDAGQGDAGQGDAGQGDAVPVGDRLLDDSPAS